MDFIDDDSFWVWLVCLSCSSEACRGSWREKHAQTFRIGQKVFVVVLCASSASSCQVRPEVTVPLTPDRDSPVEILHVTWMWFHFKCFVFCCSLDSVFWVTIKLFPVIMFKDSTPCVRFCFILPVFVLFLPWGHPTCVFLVIWSQWY